MPLCSGHEQCHMEAEARGLLQPRVSPEGVIPAPPVSALSPCTYVPWLLGAWIPHFHHLCRGAVTLPTPAGSTVSHVPPAFSLCRVDTEGVAVNRLSGDPTHLEESLLPPATSPSSATFCQHQGSVPMSPALHDPGQEACHLSGHLDGELSSLKGRSHGPPFPG